MRVVISILAAGVLLAGLPACSTRVADTSAQLPAEQREPATLPRPRQMYVADFATGATTLRLDQGVGPRLQRQLQGDDPSADEQQMLAEVRDAIADTLVGQIRKMGLPAERSYGEPPSGDDVLIVRGEILKIDQGNRTRRIGVGFGAGKSDVSARVAVFFQRAGAPAEEVRSYDADSNSGRKPGLAIGAASAASGGSLAPLGLSAALGVHSETHKTEVGKEGGKLADRVGYNLGEFFVQQGWIPSSAVPTPSLR